MKSTYIFLIIFFTIASCNTTKVEPAVVQMEVVVPPENPSAKNVILLIGDGMGMGQISAGTYANNNKTNLERFPTVGLHKPHASSHLITDSAAGATAFACGVKTFNGAIGVNKDSVAVTTILEEAETKGLKTGLVATSTIVHATPASFIAHNASRRAYEEIAEDFLDTDVDFFAGGGKKFFDRREKDDRNLIEELKTKGYTMETYLSEDAAIKMSMEKSEKFGYLTSDEDPLPYLQGRDYLINTSMNGINFLNVRADQSGFFMMIESSQIDWGGHANNQEYILSEFQEFDQLLGKVLDWAEQDGETLVVVTADHETGGFTIHHESTMDSLITNFTSTKHTGDFIPVFAYGPQSEKFSGLYENNAIYGKMRSALGWSNN